MDGQFLLFSVPIFRAIETPYRDRMRSSSLNKVARTAKLAPITATTDLLCTPTRIPLALISSLKNPISGTNTQKRRFVYATFWREQHLALAHYFSCALAKVIDAKLRMTRFGQIRMAIKCGSSAFRLRWRRRSCG